MIIVVGVHVNMKTENLRSGWSYGLWKRLRRGVNTLLCDEWRNDFVKFNENILLSQKPEKGFTVKPIIESLGYCEGNLHIAPLNYKTTSGKDRKGNLLVNIGDTSGNWVALQDSKYLGHKDKVLCKCICGVIREVSIGNFKSSRTKSCGCSMPESKYKCRDYQTEYSSYKCMMDRCLNEESPHYKRYGSVGISVCEKWKEGFEYFLDDMGRKPPKTTLDRIDPKGNYCKENCRWSSAREQALNKVKVADLPYCTKDGNKFKGVYFENRKFVYVGLFNTKEESFLATVQHMIVNGVDVPEQLMQKYLDVSKKLPNEI